MSPSILVFRKRGQTKTVKIKLGPAGAPLGEPAFGALSLRGAGTTARVPIAVTTQALDAPELVTGTGASDSLTYSVKPGFSGPFPITEHGLVAADRVEGEVSAVDGLERRVQLRGAGELEVRPVRSPPRTIRPVTSTCVYRVVDGELIPVAESASSSGTEEITLISPSRGSYVSFVTPYSDPPGQTATRYTYTAVAVGPAVGNYTVTPANPTATVDVPLTLTATWSGLDPAKKYYG